MEYMPNSSMSVRNGDQNRKLKVFDINQIGPMRNDVAANTPSTAAVISRHMNRMQNQSSSFNFKGPEPGPHNQSQYLPKLIHRPHKNASQIIISDDTYCLMKNSDLRNEAQGNANQVKRDKFFTKSGQNTIPIGVMGQAQTLRDKNIYSNADSDGRDLYQASFKNSRLNSKGAMHDYRVAK